MSRPHAKAFDLPGWPCPPRARDVVAHTGSWGWIPVIEHAVSNTLPVVQDELGYLWINGDIALKFRIPNDAQTNPGAIVYQCDDGIGLWIHPKSLTCLPSISRLDMTVPDQWCPVNETASERRPAWS